MWKHIKIFHKKRHTVDQCEINRHIDSSPESQPGWEDPKEDRKWSEENAVPSPIVNTAWKYTSYGYHLAKKETLRSKWTALPQICPDWDYLPLQLAVTSEKGNNAISKLSLHHGTAQLVTLELLSHSPQHGTADSLLDNFRDTLITTEKKVESSLHTYRKLIKFV